MPLPTPTRPAELYRLSKALLAPSRIHECKRGSNAASLAYGGRRPTGTPGPGSFSSAKCRICTDPIPLVQVTLRQRRFKAHDRFAGLLAPSRATKPPVAQHFARVSSPDSIQVFTGEAATEQKWKDAGSFSESGPCGANSTRSKQLQASNTRRATPGEQHQAD